MSSIQSSLVPIELSFDSGSTWQTLVCLTQYNLPLETATNQVETFCGTETGLGSQTFNPTGTAVHELTPLPTQVSYTRMLTAWSNKELIQFRSQYPGTGSIGSQFYHRGSAYVTSLSPSFQVGQVVQFDWTLTGTGTLDITP